MKTTSYELLVTLAFTLLLVVVVLQTIETEKLEKQVNHLLIEQVKADASLELSKIRGDILKAQLLQCKNGPAKWALREEI